MLQDISYAVRSLVKDRGVTAIVLACLGLGIGVNATIFAILDGVLLQPLPFTEPERLVVVHETSERNGVTRAAVSYQNLRDFKSRATSFTHIAGISFRSLTFSDRDAEPERVQGAAISWELFPMLGVPPQLGRHFNPQDDRPGAEPVVILSDVMWRVRYHADPAIIGKSVTVNAQPRTVIAVMPVDFGFPENERAWIPLAPVAEVEPRDNRNLFTFGRLKGDVTFGAAQTEIAAIATRMADEYPATNRDWSARLRSASEDFTPPDVHLIISTMMGAVTLVLLIACANVANLMLARASVRQREFSVRAALGASRARMVRQLLTECVILGIAAAPLGVAVAWIGVYLLDSAVPAGMVPYYIHWAVDWRTTAYTIVIAALTGIVFGLAPALQAGRLNMLESLRDGSRGTGTSGRKAFVRNALVVAEVSLALVLLVGASLFVRSFLNLQGTSPGFATAPLMAMRVFMAGDPYKEEQQRTQRIDDIVRRIEALPGVEAAFASNFVPLDAGGGGGNVIVEGRSVPEDEAPFIGFHAVTPHLQRTLGLNLLRGRDFTDAEGMSRSPVALINDTMAKRFWADSDPIGRRFRLQNATATDWFTVIGVTPNLRNDDPTDDQPPMPTAFVPYPYAPTVNTGIVIRTAGDPAAIMTSARAAIRASDSGLPIFNVRTMEDLRTLGFWQFRLFGYMFATFGAIALLLASIGVYGVLSFSVSQRTQEIGLRMALGAGRPDVLRMVVRHGLTLAWIGIVVGLVGAFGITRVIRTMLFNVTPTDPISFGGVAIFLTLIAFAASYLPARRATTVDPIVALRNE